MLSGSKTRIQGKRSLIFKKCHGACPWVSTREIVRIQKEESGEAEEVWTGDYVFENEWQSFRTKKDRSIELKSAFHECQPGRRKIAVKVVDIFGNDTMKVIEVTI